MNKEHQTVRRALTLGDIVAWSRGVTALGREARSARVATVWNDSRKVTKGDVFVALKSERDDGHRFVNAAFAAGAAAVIVDRRTHVECAPRDARKLIAVDDPLVAVQRVAARYRKELGILIVGVTGSSGKTTTRSFVAAVLKSALPVGETYTNWNNHIGVPQSILRFTGGEWAGVIEMGANHEGEISVLSKIVRPDIALITNIGYAHVGLFGSLAATTRAKFEIVDGLAPEGFLLCNGDDPRLVAGARKRGVRTEYFGLSPRCKIRPSEVSFDAAHGLSFVLDGQKFRLEVPGRHFLYSALPAVFLGRRCGIPDDRIAQALAAQRPVALRGTVVDKHGIRFIVDCYNANPSSMKSAIGALLDLAGKRKKVAVVGDMLELGSHAKRLHRELGRSLAENGIKKVVAVGDWAGAVADGALAAGMKPERIRTAQKAEAAAGIVKRFVAPGEMVLLKGSRGMHLETVLEQW
jgi:UDP-N-acetylmuramoyl-tripeptide--D-alanyl-D-alanine ligase